MLFLHGPVSDEGIELVGRSRLCEPRARMMVVKEMLIMRARGYTDAEIGIKYRYRRETVNRMINSAPDDVKEQLREIRLV